MPSYDERASGTRMVVESRRKHAIRQLADRLAPERDAWIERNRFYHEEDERFLRFLVGPEMPQTELNWLSAQDLAGIMALADFEVVRLDSRQIVPKRVGGLGGFANRFVGTLPGIRHLALRNYVVARPGRESRLGQRSATLVLPCHNAAGNIEPAIDRLPPYDDDIDVIFVEDHSRDITAPEV